MITWREIINLWKNNYPLKYKSFNNKFGYHYMTSCCDRNYKNEYIEIFTEDVNYYLQQDYNKFITLSNIDKSYNNWGNEEVFGSFNSKNNSYFIFPKPTNDKNYADIRLFITTAPKKTQILFWKYVAATIETLFKLNPDVNTIFLSSNNHQLPYFCIILSCYPRDPLSKINFTLFNRNFDYGILNQENREKALKLCHNGNANMMCSLDINLDPKNFFLINSDLNLRSNQLELGKYLRVTTGSFLAGVFATLITYYLVNSRESGAAPITPAPAPGPASAPAPGPAPGAGPTSNGTSQTVQNAATQPINVTTASTTSNTRSRSRSKTAASTSASAPTPAPAPAPAPSPAATTATVRSRTPGRGRSTETDQIKNLKAQHDNLAKVINTIMQQQQQQQQATARRKPTTRQSRGQIQASATSAPAVVAGPTTTSTQASQPSQVIVSTSVTPSLPAPAPATAPGPGPGS